MLADMSAPKPASTSVADPVLDDEDPVLRSIEGAPLDPDALTDDEKAELDARFARAAGTTFTTAEVLERIADRAKHEE